MEYKEVHEQTMARVQDLLHMTDDSETRSSLKEIIEESSTALEAMRRAAEIRKVS